MVKDIENSDTLESTYTFRYFSRQSPVLINYLARRAGVKAAPVDAPYTYLDLGCGNGVSLNTLAAAAPQGQFFGVDIMPQHITNAREMAEAGELSNATFVESSFRDLPGENLPQFDYIALQGVYSWVSAAERQHIRTVIDLLLKPNGVVFVSYNALPGQASFAPLRNIFRQYAASLSGGLLERAAGSLKYLKYLKKNGARYVQENPLVSATIDDLSHRDIRYVAHEYLAEHHSAFGVKSVAAEMAEKSLQFCCGVPQGPAWVSRGLLKEFQPMLNAQATILDREAAKSVLLNESFRADLYCRQDHERFEDGDTDVFLNSVFGATNLIPLSHPPSRGLNAEATKILQTFSPGAATLQELSESPDLENLTPERLTEFMHYMVEDYHLQPFARQVSNPTAAVPDKLSIPSAFNRNILRVHLFDTGRCSLASPVVGDGIAVDLISGLFLLARTEAPEEDPVEYADNALVSSGRAWRRNGVVISDPAQRRAVLTEDLANFNSYRLPLLWRLGIVQ
jgi:ubiquinone/menaquinone biosynthesis C-methylase UbiE